MSPAFSILSALLHSGLVLTSGWLLLLLTGRGLSSSRCSAAHRVLTAAVLATFVCSFGQSWMSSRAETASRSPDISADTRSALPASQGGATNSLPAASGQAPVAAAADLFQTSEKQASTRLLSIAPARWPVFFPRGQATILCGLWGCGALFMLGLWSLGLAARKRLLRHSRRVTGAAWLPPASSKTRTCASVRLHSGEVMPCAWGIRHPMILLPGSAAHWPLEKLRLILAHENAHLARRDPFWQLLRHLLLSVFWFHPAAWDLARRSRGADERAADDSVLVLNTTDDAPAYASLLVECARQFTLPTTLKITTHAMSSHHASLTRRVESLLNPRADRRTAGPGLLLRWTLTACGLTALSGLAIPRLEAAQETAASPSVPRLPEGAPANSVDAITTAVPETSVPPTPSANPAPAPDAGIPGTSSPEASPPEPAAKAGNTRGFDWNLIQVEDKDYVPAARIAAFYQFDLSRSGFPELLLRSPKVNIKGGEGSRELRINNVLQILQFPVIAKEGNLLLSRQDLVHLIDPVCRPRQLSGKVRVSTVIIDAGHGGRDSGAMSSGGSESALALDLALRLKKSLDTAGLQALLTRPEDTFVALSDRVAIAAAQPDAVLISLHFNSGKGAPPGIQTSVPEGEDLDSTYLQASRALGVAIHAQCLYDLRCADGGIRPEPYKMLIGQSNNPAIQLCGGNLSNPDEAAKIADPAYRQKLAEDITKGLQNFIRATR